MTPVIFVSRLIPLITTSTARRIILRFEARTVERKSLYLMSRAENVIWRNNNAF